MILRLISGISLDSTVQDIFDAIEGQDFKATNSDGEVDYNKIPRMIVADYEELPKSIRRLPAADVMYIEGLKAISSRPYLENQKRETRVSDLIIDEREGFFLIPAALTPADRK